MTARGRSHGDLEQPADDFSRDWVQATRLVHELRVHQLELETQNQALREARAEAEAGWDHYRELYEFAPVGYFTLDARGVILQVNLEGSCLLGVDRDQLVGSRFALFVAPGDRVPFAEFLALGLERPEPQDCEVSLPREGEAPAQVRLKGLARAPGEDLRLVAVDITALHEAREEVGQLNWELEARVASRTAELEVANADLQAFTYMISHELRAPLARMEGFSRMLGRSLADPAAIGHIAERIEASGQRMREVVDSLLGLARLALERVAPETVDLSVLARDVLQILAREGRPVPARVRIEPGVTVRGDRRLLQICLHNLVGNAVKFSARVPEPEVTFGRTRHLGRACCFVRDNGAGFDPAHADKLFQAFVRLHRQDEFEGTGLGLNIARKIIEKHGGAIWAEAAPGAGATFYFTLPSHLEAP